MMILTFFDKLWKRKRKLIFLLCKIFFLFKVSLSQWETLTHTKVHSKNFQPTLPLDISLYQRKMLSSHFNENFINSAQKKVREKGNFPASICVINIWTVKHLRWLHKNKKVPKRGRENWKGKRRKKWK